MKKLTAWILSLALLFALTLPAAAGEVRDLPVIGSLLKYAEGEQPYGAGYDAGYDVGYEEGYAKGQINDAESLTSSYEYNPYAYNSQPDYTRYEDGYENGFYHGYSSGFEEGWQSTKPYYQQYNAAYEAGYAEGFAAGKTWYPDSEKLDEIPWAWLIEPADDVNNGEAGYADGHKDGYRLGAISGYYEAEDAETARLEQLSREEELAECGGAPGQINVMVNGACLDLSAAPPQLKDHRTMIPLRGVAEALGASVVHSTNGKIAVTWNDVQLETQVGEKIVSVTRDGDTSPITMDCASYLDGDRVYVPLRFLSEAIGYDVLWDENYQTAVLLDRKTVVAALNTDFTVSNLLLADQKVKTEEAYQVTSDLTVEAEIIDTIDGNRKATMTGRSDAHIQGMTMDLTSQLDLTQLWSLLENSASLVGVRQDTMEQWKKDYSQFTLNMKVDETGAYYLQCPMLAQFLALDDPASWVLIAQIDPDLLEGNLTVGDLLYGSFVTPNAYEPFQVYHQLTQAGNMISQLIGDDTFTKSGTTYQWSFGLEELASLLELDAENRAELEGILRRFDKFLTFQTNGNYEVKGDVKVGVPGLGSLLRAAFQESGSPSGSKGSGTMQIRNLLNLTSTSKTSRQKTSQSPDTALPQDAAVIDLTGGMILTNW